MLATESSADKHLHGRLRDLDQAVMQVIDTRAEASHLLAQAGRVAVARTIAVNGAAPSTPCRT